MSEGIHVFYFALGYLLPLAAVAVQFVVWFLVIKALILKTADREDVIMLIPLTWVIFLVILIVKEVPNAWQKEPQE